ncbi:hypothetical protein LNP74_00625 [Klebsiella pneumoniae subsp. pneumoniae]|nr:hypothetical protein [Klebsiella pneumoniae subsp. pneumoniae]
MADAVALLLAGNKLSDSELNTLGDLIGERDIEAAAAGPPTAIVEDAQAARQELISMLMDRHGTSRVLFRNTRNGVKGFPKRELHTIHVCRCRPSTRRPSRSPVLWAGAQNRGRRARVLYPEQIYQEFEGDTGTWWNFDPRVEWLMGYLTSHRSQKVLMNLR